jgi:CheY-like chemotaxis protein
MSSILILEDNPARVRSFRRNIIGIPITHAATAPQAISWLSRNTPNLIFLDFDLDQFGTSAKIAGYGIDVASWISKHPRQFEHTLVVIHSLNEGGAALMLDRIHSTGTAAMRFPSVWDKPSDLDRLTRMLR